MSLAMAGIFQSAALVDQIARTGYIPNDEYRACINSLFEQNPDTTEAVYGGAENLKMGLGIMARLLDMHSSTDHPHTMRYVMSLLHLQSKLSRDQAKLSLIDVGLKQASRQQEHFQDGCHESVIANLAEIYTDTLSGYKFRIQVSGDANYLQQARVAQQIRALLFSGIRSSILWRQLGGSRLKILFQRKKLKKSAEQWLASFQP